MLIQVDAIVWVWRTHLHWGEHLDHGDGEVRSAGFSPLRN
jgi:hypothetical protein